MFGRKRQRRRGDVTPKRLTPETQTAETQTAETQLSFDESLPVVTQGAGFLNSIILLVATVVLVVVVAWGVPFAVTQLQEGQGAGFRPEIILPVILLIGLITLLGVLAGLAATFSRLGLASRTAPLGMPEGSVQAVIALGLIIIFAIVGVYLHGAAGDDSRILPGLNRVEVEALPANTIVRLTGIGDGKYDVQVVATNTEQHDLALQLLTTVSTLVVAVAGFYFGQKSVGEASKAIGVAVGPSGTDLKPNATTAKAGPPGAGNKDPGGEAEGAQEDATSEEPPRA